MTVSEQIIQVLNALCEKFGMAIDWTSENVIPYITTLCTKLITYEIWTSILTIINALVFAIILAILVKKLYPRFKRGWEENRRSYFDVGWQVGSIMAIIGVVVASIFIICAIEMATMDIIKCVTFPEMYIFEYIQGAINSGG